MACRGLAAIALALPLLVAGCIGGGEPVTTQELPPDGAVNTLPPEGRKPLAAFNETNRTEAGAGGVEHGHDLWAGRERVEIFQVPANMTPFPGTGGVSATFRPPQGTLVFEGTASVEFTISDPQRHVCEPAFTLSGHFLCTDYLGEGRPSAPPVADPTGGPSGLKLRYKHASTAEWIDGGALTWGTPLVLAIRQPIETDMPHATSSVWEFQVVSPRPEDATLKFKAKAEIVRAVGEIPRWPAHPLFYTEETPSRVVVEPTKAVACDSGFTNTGCVLAGDAEPVIPTKLISYGTRTLDVWINITSYTPTNPATAPGTWFLFHRNATGRDNITNAFDVETYGIDKRELHWTLPVDDGSMDSPYADASRWEFELGAALPKTQIPGCIPNEYVPCQLVCYSGCSDWSAEYTITVIASSIVLPPASYHMSCLDEQDYCPQPEGSPGRRYVRESADGRTAGA